MTGPPQPVDLMGGIHHAVAIDIVARHLVASLASVYAAPSRDLYPDIGQDDWDRIAERAGEVAEFPATFHYLRAYNYLQEQSRPDRPGLPKLREQWEALATEPLDSLPKEVLIASIRDLAGELLVRTSGLTAPPPS